MTDQEHKKMAHELLDMLQKFAPNAEAQTYCVHAYQLAQQYSAPRELVRVMVNCLADGLNYGNWPWIFRPEDSE